MFELGRLILPRTFVFKQYIYIPSNDHRPVYKAVATIKKCRP